MTEQTQREKIMNRILNLRARAEDDAASEAEMNTAFSMAVKLMDSYNIEEAELALAETQGKIKLDIVHKKSDVSLFKNTKQKHKVVNTLNYIAKFADCKVVFNTYSGTITFTGHRPDTELANYLVAVIRSALDLEYDAYRKRIAGATGYGAKASFQIAMANRINQRLLSMKNDQDRDREKAKQEALKIENASTASSTALVIAEANERKKIEVEAAYRKAHPSVRNVSLGGRVTNGTAHGAGKAAGDKVNLGRAISQGSTLKIGTK